MNQFYNEALTKLGPNVGTQTSKLRRNNLLSVNAIGQRGSIGSGLFRHATVLTEALQLFRMTVVLLTLGRWPLPGR